MDKLEPKIGIIGFGHMGKALLKGFLKSGFKKENVLTSNKLLDNGKS